MLPPIFQALKASTAVKAIVGSNPPRIYRHGKAPQRPDNLPLSDPYITWFVVVGDPQNTLSELPAVDRQTLQVDCWYPSGANGDKGIELLADAARDAIEPHAHMTGVIFDGQEPETLLYRNSMQFDWFLSR